MADDKIRLWFGGKPYSLKVRAGKFNYYGVRTVFNTSITGTNFYILAANTGIYSYTGEPATLVDIPAGSFDFYISPTGNDLNLGTTPAAAWAITAINSKGATYQSKRVGLLPGTYSLYAMINAAGTSGGNTVPILQITAGTSASPTVIAATTARKAILDAHQTPGTTGSGYPTGNSDIIGQAYSQTTLGNVVIDGLVITGGASSGIHYYGGGNVEGNGATGHVARNCEIYDFLAAAGGNVAGVLFHNVTGALVSNNVLHDIGFSGAGLHHANAGGVHSWGSRSNIYEYNTIYNVGAGVHEKLASFPDNANGTFRYNYIVLPTDAADGYCLNVGPGSGNTPAIADTITVHHNILVAQNVNNWITPIQTVITLYQTSYNVYNNTCYTTVSSGAGGGGANFYCGGTNVVPTAQWTNYNNIYLFGASTGFPSFGAMDASFDAANASQALKLSDYNLWQQPGNQANFLRQRDPATFSQGAVISLTTWRANGATGFDNSSIMTAAAASTIVQTPNVDPTNPQGYKLVVGTSPALNAGKVGGVAAGASVDMGAWGNSAPTIIGANFTAGN